MKSESPWWLAALVLAGSLVAACHGCHGTPRADSAQSAGGTASPTLRLYVVSNVAGALEPCGCTKDQLGGVNHLAAFLAKDRKQATSSLLVAAGPTMFLDPTLEKSRETQDRWKAEALAEALGDVGLAAFAPGYNDWAAGPEFLAAVAKSARASIAAANLDGVGPKSDLRELAGIKVGIVGVSAPEHQGARPPALEGTQAKDPTASLKAAAADLRAKGAAIVVGLAAIPRGQALRLAEAVPDLSVLVVGKPSDAGEANDAPPPPVVIGSVLVVGSSNHLQTVDVIDFFVQDGDHKFQDGSGVANAEALASLARRIHDLETRLAAWEGDKSIRPEDVAARRTDLAKLREEHARLASPPAPKSGSFFRYSLVEVREGLGSDAKVDERMKTYYRRVNDHNKVAFAGRQAPEPSRGESAYAGVEACTTCHDEAREVWNRTPHAHAYATLSSQFKEYNLDCVSCHVTGYEKPGGSTVTTNATLQNVQCEACHGPGQAHVKAPQKPGLIVRDPKPELCTGSCHHPPHVEGFDPAKAKKRILGPGHGMPSNAPWPAWATDGGTER